MTRYSHLVLSACCAIACVSCTPKSAPEATRPKVRFENLQFKDEQLTGEVVFFKAPGDHMLRMLIAEGIYQRDGVWGSEFMFLESGNWWASPAGTAASAASTNKVTRVRQNLFQLFDRENLVAVRLRALVWVGKTPPHQAEQEDMVAYAYQSRRVPVTDSDELIRALGLPR